MKPVHLMTDGELIRASSLLRDELNKSHHAQAPQWAALLKPVIEEIKRRKALLEWGITP